jgi:hypothetical protein
LSQLSPGIAHHRYDRDFGEYALLLPAHFGSIMSPSRHVPAALEFVVRRGFDDLLQKVIK